MIDLIHSHWFPLTSQGNIYSSTTLQSLNGSNKVLVASLKRNIYSFEYHQHPKWRLTPLVKELLFTYIPNGAEIIAIDAYNKSNSGEDFVIGITIIKSSGETSIERYLNIYTENLGDGEDSHSLEMVAQNCLMVELPYTPYALYHTIIPSTFDYEVVWLISGSDNRIHMVKEDKKNHSYSESQIKEYFPELDQLKAIALWIDIYYDEDHLWRVTAVSCECGMFKLTKVNVKTLEIIQNWNLRYDNPVSCVKIFPFQDARDKYSIFDVDSGQRETIELNVLLNTGNKAIIFQNILHQQMSSDTLLNGSEMTSDCILCSCIADINMDGRNEILLGTYKQEVLIYAHLNDDWKILDRKLFDAPIHSISYVDLTGDGVKVLIVSTQRSVHIMMHHSRSIVEKWKEKFSEYTLNIENIE